MTTRNPTPDVSSRYGAPMGRHGDNLSALAIAGETVTLRLIPINGGGYDAGGAYWGADEPLYWWQVTITEGDSTDDCSGFFRAASRDAAEQHIRDSHPSAKLAWDAESFVHVDSWLEIYSLPEQCILECAASGDVSDAVTRWRDALSLTVNRERAIACLAGYGAWDRETLASESDNAIAERILWLACCNFGEFISECESRDLDPFDSTLEIETRCGFSLFVLE